MKYADSDWYAGVEEYECLTDNVESVQDELDSLRVQMTR